MLNKSWMVYNGVFLALMLFCVGMDYVINFMLNTRVYNTLFTGIGSWAVVINTLFLFPAWLIVLFVKRKAMNLKSFLIGVALFLLSIGAGAYCIISLIGFMGGQT